MSDKNRGRLQGFVFTIFLLMVCFYWFAESEVGQMTTLYLKWCRQHGTAAAVEAGKQEYLKRYAEQKEAERKALKRKRDEGDQQ